MTNFFVAHWDVFLVYGLAIILVYLFRKRFEWQGIVALFRTKFGLDFMKRTGERHARFWHVGGLISITIGFLGMAFITFYLFYGIYQLLFVPAAPPVLSPILPGVSIPGVPVTLPLWYGLVALFLTIVVHEAAHGIFASAYKIKIKSSGFAVIGPIPGAFVEPDEKTMSKRPARQQLAILSGGPFSNVVLFLVGLVLCGLLIGFPPNVGAGGYAGTLVTQHVLVAPQEGGAAQAAGLRGNATLLSIDGQAMLVPTDVTSALAAKQPGDHVTLQTDQGTYDVTLQPHPTDASKPYIGIDVGLQTELKNPSQAWWFALVFGLGEGFFWVWVVSLGIGIANLIPAGPLDGGRMLYLVLQKRYKPTQAKQIFYRWSILLLVMIIFLVFVPILKAVVA